MFEKFLHQTPFVRLTFPLVFGIILQNSFNIGYLPLQIVIFSSFAIVLLLEILKLTHQYRINKLWGISLSLLFVFYGMYLVEQKQSNAQDFIHAKNTFIATVIEQPEENKNSVKTILSIQYLKDSVSWTKSNAKIMGYFQKAKADADLKLGDQIVATAYLNKIKDNKNPYAFNYKQYLKYKEIYYQSFISPTNYRIIAQNKVSKLNILSNKTRLKLLSIYSKYNIPENEYRVLSALTLGYKNELSPELKESYAASGVMHVLAVSGLHVGILFIILYKLLFFLQKNKYGKVIQSVLIITILFFYAFLTGMSNSVIRAVIMFTFIGVGKMFTRQLNIYNTIFASAFIMLLYNPYFLFEVSFQLSYLAVLSIVFFQPKIYSLFYFKRTLTDYIWQLISVSIAAQMGTFPVTMYYFDQFPLYFIITNIAVIPVVTILIYGAIFLFILSFNETISVFISKVLQLITSALNKFVYFIQQLPFSKIENINLNKFEVVFLLLFIICISLFIIAKRLYLLKLSLIILIGTISFNTLNIYIKAQKFLLVVHNIPDLCAINVIKGNTCNFICNKKIAKSDLDFKYGINPVLKKYRIKQLNKVHANNNAPFDYYSVQSKKIIHLYSNPLLNFEVNTKLKSNYIVLSEDVNISIDDLKCYFEFDELIFDSSNSKKNVARWIKECSQSRIKFFDVSREGAYVKHL